MTVATPPTRSAQRLTGPGRLVRLSLDRTRVELLTYLREKEAVFFNFLFPVVMLALFATIFANDIEGGGPDMNAARWFLPGMIAAGVVLTSFQTVASSVAVDRDDGTLKRLRATPTPPVAYFLGKILLVLITSVAQVAVLLLLAWLAYDVVLPTDAAAWLRFGWVLVLGLVGGVTLGIAYSSLASARTVGAIVIVPVILLQFISGVYFTFSALPGWIQQVAALLPMKWIAQGMRSVFYPADLSSMEMAGSWEPGHIALVLAAWAVIGLVLCLRTFRWYRRGTV